METVKSVDGWSRLRKTQTLPGRVAGLKCLEMTEIRAIPDPLHLWENILENILKL